MSSKSQVDIREVPLRSVIVTVREYVHLALRKWYILLFVGLLVGVILAYRAYQDEVRFIADITFLVNEESGGGMGVGALLGSIGIGGSGSGFNVNKIIALSKSQKIANAVLLDTVNINGVQDLVANHILKLNNLVEVWELEPGTKIDASKVDVMSIQSKGLLRSIYNYAFINPGEVCRTEAETETGILTITAQTPSETLSFEISNLTYNSLSEFYTEESIGNRRNSVEKLRSKTDSLREVLEGLEYQVATLSDKRLGLIQRRDYVQQNRAERELSMLTLAYAEVVRNFETASFALSTATPFFQVIDMPYFPLQKSESEPIKQGIIGFLIGAIFAFIVLAIMYFYTEIMRS